MITTSTTTRNENWMAVLGIKREKVPVLIVGNNPIEMTSIFNTLVNLRSRSYVIDVCFDIKDCFNRISESRPEVILVDDNLGPEDIRKMMRVLRQNAKTRNIKVIVLKSSNWSNKVIDNVDDYLLKDSIDADMLDNIIDKNIHPLVQQA